MKNLFLAVTLLALLVLGGGDVRAQAFSPYYYDPYWDAQYQQYQQYLQWQQYLAYLQQYDPYYELHVMHYQLYLQPYQPYQYTNPVALRGLLPSQQLPSQQLVHGHDQVAVRGDKGLSLRYHGRPLHCRQRSEEGKEPSKTLVSGCYAQTA